MIESANMSKKVSQLPEMGLGVAITRETKETRQVKMRPNFIMRLE